MNGNPSLEERVNDIKRRLTLIQAATLPFQYTAYDDSIDTGDLLDAIRDAADDCLELIEPIIHAPVPVATWRPEGGEK